MIKIGDWVTQYSAGYWLVLDIVPKYADEDYSYNGMNWKKGARLGDWVILKKGFTPDMKPRNACEVVDAQWCVPVSSRIVQSIEAAFMDNPKAKEKFDKAPTMPKPAITNAWMRLSDEEADAFVELFGKLPARFTTEQFWTLAADYRQFIVKPSEATHILNLFSYLWEIDENFEPLKFKPELKKI